MRKAASCRLFCCQEMRDLDKVGSQPTTERHMTTVKESLRAAIRTISDYPKPGIEFRAITTLLGNPQAYRRAIDELVHPYACTKIDKIAGIEARSFILGGAMAHQLSAGFIPIRKKGKLPHETVRIA